MWLRFVFKLKHKIDIACTFLDFCIFGCVHILNKWQTHPKRSLTRMAVCAQECVVMLCSKFDNSCFFSVSFFNFCRFGCSHVWSNFWSSSFSSMNGQLLLVLTNSKVFDTESYRTIACSNQATSAAFVDKPSGSCDYPTCRRPATQRPKWEPPHAAARWFCSCECATVFTRLHVTGVTSLIREWHEHRLALDGAAPAPSL